MKLASFSVASGPPRLGIVIDDEVIDVLHDLPHLSVDIAAWLPAGDDALRFLAMRSNGAPRLSLDGIKLHAPVRPSKLLAIGANYQCHLDEVAHLGLKPASRQIWFNKQISCVNDPFAPISIPDCSQEIDYEGELAVVIGRRARNVVMRDAMTVVGGYTICNDVSVRDVQMSSPTHTLGKSFDTHGPLGPWLVTADEIRDPQALVIKTFVNGELRQEASTATMIHSIAAQIAELSAIMTLEPGDVISTGTPAGTAAGMQQPRWLISGDRVRIEIAPIGHIEAPFVQNSNAALPAGSARD